MVPYTLKLCTALLDLFLLFLRLGNSINRAASSLIRLFFCHVKSAVEPLWCIFHFCGYNHSRIFILFYIFCVFIFSIPPVSFITLSYNSLNTVLFSSLNVFLMALLKSSSATSGIWEHSEIIACPPRHAPTPPMMQFWILTLYS